MPTGRTRPPPKVWCVTSRAGGTRGAHQAVARLGARRLERLLELHILTRPSPWMPLDAASQRRRRAWWNGERAVERSQQRARGAASQSGDAEPGPRDGSPGEGGGGRGASRIARRDAHGRAGLGIGAARGSGDAPGGGAGRARGRRAEGVAVQRRRWWRPSYSPRGGRTRVRGVAGCGCAAEVRARRGSSERTAGARGRVAGREDARARCGAKAEARDARGSTNRPPFLHRARDREITIDSARLNAHRRKMHPAADS